MNKPYGWVDEINTFVLDKDYRQLPKILQNGMTPLYANKVPDGLIDPKSFYEGYENGKKSQRAKLENRLGRTTVIKSLEHKSSPPNTKKGTREMNAYEIPLVELLKRVPKNARFVEEKEFSSTYHPVGRLCHEAADRIAELERQNEALEQLRPYWAKGFSDDSVAAQCTLSAMSELHKLLGVDNQTDAVIKIKQQADRIAELEKQGEPVAWMGTDFEGNPTKFRLNPFSRSFPLYTTPQTKPLSDEEIEEIYKKVYEEGHSNQVVALGRAIEERHGIK